MSVFRSVLTLITVTLALAIAFAPSAGARPSLDDDALVPPEAPAAPAAHAASNLTWTAPTVAIAVLAAAGVLVAAVAIALAITHHRRPLAAQ
jgi:hypothetical protein